MHKIDEAMEARLQGIVDMLNPVSDLIAANQEAVNTQIKKLNESILLYNAILDDVDKLTDHISKDIDTYVDSKSEGWQEEHREQYEEWRSHWDEFSVQPLESVPMVEVEDHSHAEYIAEIPRSPEE